MQIRCNHTAESESAMTPLIAKYSELLIFVDEVNATDKGNAGSTAASFANQISTLQTYFIWCH
jgi:hypothetical protein